MLFPSFFIAGILFDFFSDSSPVFPQLFFNCAKGGVEL